jgi:hypothetical protein
MKNLATIVAAVVLSTAAGFGAGSLHHGDAGPQGARGTRGLPGLTGDTGASGAPASPLGVCVVNDQYSGDVAYLSLPIMAADGTASCATGVYLQFGPS